MEIKLPKTPEDLRLRHFKPLTNPKYQQAMTLFDLIDFLHDFTGEKKSSLMRIDYKDIEKMYNHCAYLYSDFKVTKKPPMDIVLDGKAFSLINPEKVGIGWHMDWTTVDIEDDPIRLACLLYFPKGCIYGETDENDNLIHPIKDRYQTIADHLPLTTFLEASGFFLNRQSELIRVYLIGRKIANKLIRRSRRSNSNGRK